MWMSIYVCGCPSSGVWAYMYGIPYSRSWLFATLHTPTNVCVCIYTFVGVCRVLQSHDLLYGIPYIFTHPIQYHAEDHDFLTPYTHLRTCVCVCVFWGGGIFIMRIFRGCSLVVISLFMIHFIFSIQPIADRVAQHLEITSKNFQFSNRRTRILMGFIIYHLVLIVNPMGRILVRWKKFRNNLEMLCHPICNWL